MPHKSVGDMLKELRIAKGNSGREGGRELGRDVPRSHEVRCVLDTGRTLFTRRHLDELVKARMVQLGDDRHRRLDARVSRGPNRPLDPLPYGAQPKRVGNRQPETSLLATRPRRPRWLPLMTIAAVLSLSGGCKAGMLPKRYVFGRGGATAEPKEAARVATATLPPSPSVTLAQPSPTLQPTKTALPASPTPTQVAAVPTVTLSPSATAPRPTATLQPSATALPPTATRQPTPIPTLAGRIAFWSDRDGNAEIYVVNANGAGLMRLTNNSAGDWRPTWSPDGKRIAFISDRDGNEEIYVMNADGSGQARLTFDDGQDINPTWCSDGATIGFDSNRDLLHGEVFVMNADGSGQRRVTTSPHSVTGPAWSPDRARIAYFSERDGNEDIYMVWSDGSGEVRLTYAAGRDRDPAWSPDGLRIAYSIKTSHVHDPSAVWGIWMMNADGSAQRQITTLCTAPAWSPDGRYIACCGDGQGGTAIVVIKADGSGLRTVVDTPGADGNPDWAP